MLAELSTAWQRQHMISPFFALVLGVATVVVVVVPVLADGACVEDMVQEPPQFAGLLDGLVYEGSL